MPRKFVDLSIYLENDVHSDPPGFRPKIEYLRHDSTAEVNTHNGTHLDAPFVHTAKR